MTERIWTNHYKQDMPNKITYEKYATVLDVLSVAHKQFGKLPAFSNLGVTISYDELDDYSAKFASYLIKHTALKPGDRIAIQLPNLIQYPIAVFGALRAGMVVVNTNPLYTTTEMIHQFNDSGAKALVALANMGDKVEQALPKTQIETVIMTEVADMHSPVKRKVMNAIIKHVKKMVPKHSIPHAVPFVKVLSRGDAKHLRSAAINITPDDTAVLQYTGGTTGVAKGAMLTHKNLVSNMLQILPFLDAYEEGKEIVISPLPLYHIFSFSAGCLAMLALGAHSILITNPRDLPSFVSELSKWKFTTMTGLNTLFVALLNNDKFRQLDFSSMKITVAGGMALQKNTAKEWELLTGSKICEGYGLTEASPAITFNPPWAIQIGSIGIPVPGTDIKIVDDNESEVSVGQPGELCVKGPQIMRGYWQQEEATAKTMTKDGVWLKTGDVAILQDDGYLRIVDRIKDMILVSGFNVYPNEVEDVATTCNDIVEAAVIGVSDGFGGEKVKIFVVASSKSLTESDVINHCKKHLTGYKVPKIVEFRDDLPKSNVGKILRKSLRD